MVAMHAERNEQAADTHNRNEGWAVAGHGHVADNPHSLVVARSPLVVHNRLVVGHTYSAGEAARGKTNDDNHLCAVEEAPCGQDRAVVSMIPLVES